MHSIQEPLRDILDKKYNKSIPIVYVTCMLPHTNTHTQTYIYTQTHTFTHTHTHTPQTHIHTDRYTQAHTYIHYTYTHRNTHTLRSVLYVHFVCHYKENRSQGCRDGSGVEEWTQEYLLLFQRTWVQFSAPHGKTTIPNSVSGDPMPSSNLLIFGGTMSMVNIHRHSLQQNTHT